MTAIVLSAIVATRWFAVRRGLVIGILTASSATGQLVFLPLAAALAEAWGWRAALLPPVVGLGLAAILAALFLRDQPSDLGLLAYGETGVAAALPPALSGTAITRAVAVLGEAVVSPIFWVLFATFFICGLSTNGLIQTHFIPLCADFGLASVAAASVLAAMGIFDILGTIGSGWLSDRCDPRKLLFWYYGLRGLSLLYLPSSSFTLYGLSFFAVFYGLDWIATVPPTVKIAATAFGRERAGIVFGWVFAAHQLGAATAAFGAGLSRAALNTYLPAFYLAGSRLPAGGATGARRPASDRCGGERTSTEKGCDVSLRYFEDLAVGQKFRSPTKRIDAGAIKAFAAEFDPQPFHLDDEAARATMFGGLAASGWHTAALSMRLCV